MLSGFIVQPSCSCLATSLSEELAKISNEELQQMILVLPTQRLASYVISQVALKRGAIIPPLVTTLENLIGQEANRLHPLRIAADGSIEFLLGQKLKDPRFEQLSLGNERELRLILGELYDHKVRTTAFPALHNCLVEDIYKNDAHIGSLHRRAEEIEQILADVEAVLEQRGLGIRSRIFAETAEMLGSHWQSQLPFGKNRMIIAGYTSMTTAWQPLLTALCQHDEVTIWLAEQPEIYHSSSPLQQLKQFIRQYRSETSYPAASLTQPNASIQILETASPYQECRAVVRLCEDLMTEGQDPCRIAILVTSEGDYQKYLRTLIAQSKLTCNIALSFQLRDVSMGRWIQLVRDLCLKPFHITRLLALCSHPITMNWWSSHEPEQSGNYHQIAEFLSLKKISGSWDQLVEQTKETAFAASFARLYQSLQPFLSSHSKSLASRFVEWDQLLSEFKVLSHVEETYREAIQEALQNFHTFREDLHDYGVWELNLSEFWTLLDEHFLVADIRSIGEPLAGVQVLSLAESRLFPFDTVFLIGCNEGTFPKALPQDELLDDYLKKKMGLPGWEALEAMEDQTFHLLKERIPQLVLSRAIYYGNEPQVRSRFIEKLITEGDVEIIPISSHDPLLQPEVPGDSDINRMDIPLLPYVASCLEGIVTTRPSQLAQRVSASALEKLQRCPYRFLLDRLGIRDHKPLPFDDDTRVEGEWLHGVLEAFFTGSYQNKFYLKPLHQVCRQFDKQICLERLTSLTQLIGPTGIQVTPLFHQLLRHSWPAFVQHIKRLYQDQWQALEKGQREASFGQGSCQYRASIVLNETERHLLGRIDSIDITDRLILITDYKRRSSPEKKSISNGLSPQLSFYCAALSQQQSITKEMIMLGYWNVIRGEWIPIAAGKIAKQEGIQRGLLSKTSRVFDLDSLQEATEKLWQWREQHITDQQRYYADPSECGLCDYENICRRNDSTQNQRILEQSFLSSDFLKKETP